MNRCIILYEERISKFDKFTIYEIANKNKSGFKYEPNIIYCCEEFNNFINTHNEISMSLRNSNNEAQVEVRFVSDLGWYGENEHDEVVIRFCPFCGGKIDLYKAEDN